LMPDYKSEGRQSCTLADIDWKLHRVLSSDKIADSDTSLVRVQLQIEESSSSNTRQISLELTRNELENVISKLDNAKKAFDQLSEQKEQ